MDLDSLQKFHDSIPERYSSLLSISDCVHWAFTENDLSVCDSCKDILLDSGDYVYDEMEDCLVRKSNA